MRKITATIVKTAAGNYMCHESYKMMCIIITKSAYILPTVSENQNTVM